MTDDARDAGDPDGNLLDALRRPVDHGGYDGYGPDPLHVQAADRIEQLLAALGTERTLYRAWRKRAEEAEGRQDPPPMAP